MNYTYRKDDLASPNATAKADGYAGYFRDQLTAKNALALRYDAIDWKYPGDTDFKPSEFTATFETKAGSWLTRYEYRHDMVNQQSGIANPMPFAGSDVLDKKSSADKTAQDVVTVSEVYTF